MKLGKLFLLPKLDLLAFRSLEKTMLLLFVWDTSWKQWAILP